MLDEEVVVVDWMVLIINVCVRTIPRVNLLWPDENVSSGWPHMKKKKRRKKEEEEKNISEKKKEKKYSLTSVLFSSFSVQSGR